MRLEIDPKMLKEELLGTYESPEGTKFPKDIEISNTVFVNSVDPYIEADISRDWLFEEIGKIILKRWVEEGEIYYTDEDIQVSVTRAAIKTAADDLIKQGILDSIEDENGEEVIFITEKGREYAEKWGIGKEEK
jgi:predicted transcriptional regulator